MKTYLRLLGYLRTQSKNIVGALIGTIIIAGTTVIVIPVVGQLARAIGNKDFLQFNIIIAIALALYFLRGLATYGQGYMMAFAAQRVSVNIRMDLFRHLQALSMDFYSKWRTGEIISRATNDLHHIQESMMATVVETLPNILSLIGITGYLFYLDWQLMLLTLVTFPVLIFAMVRFGTEMRAIAHEAQKRMADISAILQEKISGIRVVKSFTQEKYEIKKFEEASEESFWWTMRSFQIEATQRPVINFMQALGVVLVVWFGGYRVVTGNLAPDQLIAFFTGIGLLIEPMGALSRFNVVLQRAIAGATRVFELIDLPPSITDQPHARDMGRVTGQVKFADVTFQYPGQHHPSLKNIRLHVVPGEVVALVGPSGAGKSTMVNLILRFYDPDAGIIQIDGMDIRDVTLSSLRRNVGVVPQDTFLFSGTIQENIAYGKIEATEDEIREAARVANADIFIRRLPNTYQTLVGERGVLLSGGERQRIAIARAVLRDTSILILDEATSHLDAESEKLVQEATERLMKGRTTLIIAHRFSTIQRANHVVVMEQGEIIEAGSHRELLAKDGLYQRLYSLQFVHEAIQTKL